MARLSRRGATSDTDFLGLCSLVRRGATSDTDDLGLCSPFVRRGAFRVFDPSSAGGCVPARGAATARRGASCRTPSGRPCGDGELGFFCRGGVLGLRPSGRPRMRRAQARGAERRVSDISLDDAAGFRRENALGLATFFCTGIARRSTPMRRHVLPCFLEFVFPPHGGPIDGTAT